MTARGDERGQSEVIGFILVFAIIVAFIGLNQAFLVPQSNEDVEFQHSQDVQRDLVTLRSTLIEAAASNEPRAASIRLGANYPSRFLAINPPAPAGTLQTIPGDGNYTSSHSALNLTQVCGTDGPPDTKLLRYNADYNEYANSLPLTLENTVAYRNSSTGVRLFNTDQIFVQGTTINIIRIEGELQRSSTQTSSVDLLPSRTGRIQVSTQSESLSIEIPTELSATNWNTLIESGTVTATDVLNRDRVEFSFDDGNTYDIRCTTIGVNSEPDVTPTDFTDTGNDSDSDFSLNPNTMNSVVLQTASVRAMPATHTVDVEFWNRANTSRTMTEARIAFYSPDGQGGTGGENSPSHVQFPGMVDFAEVLGPYHEITTLPPSIPANGTFTFSLSFFCSATPTDGYTIGNGDYFALSIIFENGDQANYFVQPTDASGSGNNPC